MEMSVHLLRGHLALYLAGLSGNRQAHLYPLDSSFLEHQMPWQSFWFSGGNPFTHTNSSVNACSRQDLLERPPSKKCGKCYQRSSIYLREPTATHLLFSSLRISLPTVNVLQWHAVPFLPGSHLSMCGHLLNVGGDSSPDNGQGFDIINQEERRSPFSIRWSLYLSR